MEDDQPKKKKRLHRRDTEFAKFGVYLNQKILYFATLTPTRRTNRISHAVVG